MEPKVHLHSPGCVHSRYCWPWCGAFHGRKLTDDIGAATCARCLLALYNDMELGGARLTTYEKQKARAIALRRLREKHEEEFDLYMIEECHVLALAKEEVKIEMLVEVT